MKLRLLTVFVAALVFAATLSTATPLQAQTSVDLAGILTRGVGQPVGFRAQAALLSEIGPISLGFQLSDQKQADQQYGPRASLNLGTWRLNPTGSKTIGIELFGWTNVAGGFDFDNGVVGAGCLVDLIPQNRIKESVKLLWQGAQGMQQTYMVSLGLRIALEKL